MKKTWNTLQVYVFSIPSLEYFSSRKLVKISRQKTNKFYFVKMFVKEGSIPDGYTRWWGALPILHKKKDIALVILSRLFNLCYRRFYSAYENVNLYSYTVGYNFRLSLFSY